MYYLPKIIRKFKLRSIKNSKIDSKCTVLGGCTLLNVTMKQYSYIGSDATIINTEIGSFCSIAGGCMIGGGEHPIDHVSTSPVFHSGRNCLKINFANCEFQPYHKTIIGNDVWIGARCLIKGGVTIGDGAILGMGSILTHDIPPYEIWAGNPAKFIRKRFSDEIINKLLVLQWWNLSDSELRCIGNRFDNPQDFFKS